MKKLFFFIIFISPIILIGQDSIVYDTSLYKSDYKFIMDMLSSEKFMEGDIFITEKKEFEVSNVNNDINNSKYKNLFFDKIYNNLSLEKGVKIIMNQTIENKYIKVFLIKDTIKKSNQYQLSVKKIEK